jgi:hypothetical protein
MRIEKQAEAQGARYKVQGIRNKERHKVRGTKAQNEAHRRLDSMRGSRREGRGTKMQDRGTRSEERETRNQESSRNVGGCLLQA